MRFVTKTFADLRAKLQCTLAQVASIKVWKNV